MRCCSPCHTPPSICVGSPDTRLTWPLCRGFRAQRTEACRAQGPTHRIGAPVARARVRASHRSAAAAPWSAPTWNTAHPTRLHPKTPVMSRCVRVTSQRMSVSQSTLHSRCYRFLYHHTHYMAPGTICTIVMHPQCRWAHYQHLLFLLFRFKYLLNFRKKWNDNTLQGPKWNEQWSRASLFSLSFLPIVPMYLRTSGWGTFQKQPLYCRYFYTSFYSIEIFRGQTLSDRSWNGHHPITAPTEEKDCTGPWMCIPQTVLLLLSEPAALRSE